MKKILFITAVLSLSFLSCRKEKEKTLELTPAGETLTYVQLDAPYYFPQAIFQSDNLLSKEGIALGRRLYYDSILSNTGKSCSSCHSQSLAFTDPISNSMPHMNLAWNSKFLWNGGVEGTLENAMDFEVNIFFNTNVSKLNNSTIYPALFKKVFGTTTISSKEIAYALAQFIRTQTSYNSKLDKYLKHEIMLSPSELSGFVIYNSEKGDCFHCHSLGLFNDDSYHNIGIDSIFSGVKLGRYNVTHNPNDIGKFKTPSLRNVELTAPYMHDGRFLTLEEVIEHYNTKVKKSSTLDPILTKPSHEFGLQLSIPQKADLLAFLKTLTDTTFIHNSELSAP